MAVKLVLRNREGIGGECFTILPTLRKENFHWLLSKGSVTYLQVTHNSALEIFRRIVTRPSSYIYYNFFFFRLQYLHQLKLSQSINEMIETTLSSTKLS